MILQPSDFRTVGWAFGMAEAALAVSVLNSAGIYVLLHSHYHASVALQYVTALGGVELRVPSSQAEDAIALLSEASFLRSNSSWWRVVLATVFVLFWFAIPVPPGGLFVARAVVATPRSDRA